MTDLEILIKQLEELRDQMERELDLFEEILLRLREL